MRPLLPMLLFLSLLQCTLAQPTLVLFPGDTNNDGICNHYDLLPVGLKYNFEFIPRTPQIQDWSPQPFLSWPDSLPVSHVNTGFADADGNGFIDDTDLDVFSRNYDETQTTSQPAPQSWLDRLTDTLFSSAMPLLQLTFDRDTAREGDTLIATIRYAIPPEHPSQVLGIALWLSYPTENVIDVATRIFPDTTNPLLMYLGATPGRVDIWRSIPPGNIQLAAAARGNNDISGSGILAQMHIIIEDKVIARDRPFRLDCKEVLLLNKAEQVIPVIFLKDSVWIEKKVNVPEPGAVDGSVHIFPNPSSGMVCMDGQAAVSEWLLFDTNGVLVARKSAPPFRCFSLKQLPAGVYFLKIITKSAILTRKLVKQ